MTNEMVKYNKYDEVYGVLCELGSDFIKMIPKNVIQNIVDQMSYKIVDGSKLYNIPKYDLKESLVTQGISKGGLAMVYVIYSDYCCENEDEKRQLAEVLHKNYEFISQSKTRKYGNTEDMFKRVETQRTAYNNKLQNQGVKSTPQQQAQQISVNTTQSQLQPSQQPQRSTALVKQEKWYQKLFRKIARLFKRK